MESKGFLKPSYKFIAFSDIWSYSVHRGLVEAEGFVSTNVSTDMSETHIFAFCGHKSHLTY